MSIGLRTSNKYLLSFFNVSKAFLTRKIMEQKEEPKKAQYIYQTVRHYTWLGSGSESPKDEALLLTMV